MKALLLLITSMLLFTACQPEEVSVSTQFEQLVGEWRLVEPASAYAVTMNIAVDASVSTIAGVRAYMFTGRAPVNTYFQRVTFSDGTHPEAGPARTASVGGVVATKIGGSPEATQFEQTYFTNLRAVNRYELTNQNRLRLHYGGTQPGVLVYEKI